MGYLRFNYRSDALNKWVDISVVYPTDIYAYYDMTKGVRHHVGAQTVYKRQYKPGMKFQTVYLIHGGGDDDTTPYRYMSLERYAQDNNVMLVTPDIANSFGADAEYGVEHMTFLTEELPVIMQTMFASSDKREDNFIAGYAMGGNVAMTAALMAPERYCVACDMSGGIGYTLDTEELKKNISSDRVRNGFKLYAATFGDPKNLENSKHNVYKAATQVSEEYKKNTKFYFWAGSEEGHIRDRCKKDSEILAGLGFDAEYECFEGYGHNYKLWDMLYEKLFNDVLPLDR